MFNMQPFIPQFPIFRYLPTAQVVLEYKPSNKDDDDNVLNT